MVSSVLGFSRETEQIGSICVCVWDAYTCAYILEKYSFIFILRSWLNLLMKAESQVDDKEIL